MIVNDNSVKLSPVEPCKAGEMIPTIHGSKLIPGGCLLVVGHNQVAAVAAPITSPCPAIRGYH
jgi:hypothetical protein